MWNITSLCSEKYRNKSKQLSVQNLKRKNTVHVNTCADIQFSVTPTVLGASFSWLYLWTSWLMYISTFSLYQMEKKWCEMRLTLYDRAEKKGRYLVYVLNPDKTKGPPGLSFFWTLWAGAAGFKSLQHSDKKEGERWTFPHQIPLIQHW